MNVPGVPSPMKDRLLVLVIWACDMELLLTTCSHDVSAASESGLMDHAYTASPGLAGVASVVTCVVGSVMLDVYPVSVVATKVTWVEVEVSSTKFEGTLSIRRVGPDAPAPLPEMFGFVPPNGM